MASIMQVSSMVPAAGSCLRGVVAFPQHQQQRVAARSVRQFRVRAESATGSVAINPSIKTEVDTVAVGELEKPVTPYSRYQLPTWAEFEMGIKPVFWETQTGLPPASGEMLTIYFNPTASQLVPRTEYGIGFNGGFNQPIMCGGEPRIMTRKERGVICEPFYIMKINVPEHALSLEFSFTDGTSWDGPYKVYFEVPAKWRNEPLSFFNEGLAETLSRDGACESAIFPEPTFVQDRCSFPANLTIEGGDRCELDLVPGCTDPENPFYDPLANVEDGSCPYISDSDSE